MCANDYFEHKGADCLCLCGKFNVLCAKAIQKSYKTDCWEKLMLIFKCKEMFLTKV